MLARRRTYDPITGRFLEPDPIGAAGGLELYQYGNGDPVNFVDPMGTTPVAIGDSCATGGAAPVIHFDPIRTQTHEMMGQNAAASMDELMAPSGLAQNAYITGLIAGQKWITGLDLTATNNPFGKGPLCVVNCSGATESTGEDQPETATSDADQGQDIITGITEEIVVIGQRLPEDGGSTPVGPARTGCVSDCDVPDDAPSFRRGPGTPIGGSNLATAFHAAVEKKLAGHAMIRHAMWENVKGRATAFKDVAVGVWNAGPVRVAGAAIAQVVMHPIDAVTNSIIDTKDLVVDYIALPLAMPSLAYDVWTVETTAEAADVAERALDAGEIMAQLTVEVGAAMVGGSLAKRLAPDAGTVAKVVEDFKPFTLPENNLSPPPLRAFSIASTLGESKPMQVVRTVEKGERLADIIDEGKGLTYMTGDEHALVTLADGSRAIVSGGPGGIDFEAGQIIRLFGHTHPTVAGPSITDATALKALGQTQQSVFHGGLVTKVRPPR
jgi:hypothetical protein